MSCSAPQAGAVAGARGFRKRAGDTALSRAITIDSLSRIFPHLPHANFEIGHIGDHAYRFVKRSSENVPVCRSRIVPSLLGDATPFVQHHCQVNDVFAENAAISAAIRVCQQFLRIHASSRKNRNSESPVHLAADADSGFHCQIDFDRLGVNLKYRGNSVLVGANLAQLLDRRFQQLP